MFLKINLYLCWKMLKGLSIAFSLVITITGLIAFVELSRSIGSRVHVNFFDLSLLTILQLPSLIEQTLPIIFLTGSLWTFFHLNKTHELVILRASGLSIWNILKAPIFLALLFGILAATIYNPVAARMKTGFETLKNYLTYEKRNIPYLTDGIWMREGNPFGQTVIHAKSANLEQITLNNVTFYYYEYNSDHLLRFIQRMDAKTASLKPGFWQLEDIKESKFGDHMRKYAHMSIPTNINLDTIYTSASVFTKTFSFWELPKTIKQTKQAGFSTKKLTLYWHSLIAQPLVLISMVLIAALVSFRHSRSTNILKFIAIGSSVGFFLYFINGLLYALGESDALPIILAVWSSPCFALFCALSILFFTEDG